MFKKEHKRKAHRETFAITILLLLVVTSCFPTFTSIENDQKNYSKINDCITFSTTSIYVDPASKTVPMGESSTIDIYCNPTVQIRSFQFNISFNPDILQIDEVTNVGKIFTDANKPIFSGEGTIDNVEGTVSNIYAAIKGPNNVSTPGKFATLEFTIINDDSSSHIDLTDVKVTNKTDYILININNGTVRAGSFCIDAGGPYNSEPNEAIQFNGRVIYGGTPPYIWTWDFGDGTTSTEQNPVHTYTSSNRFSVELTVEDNKGNTSFASTTATTINANTPVLKCQGSLSESELKPGAIIKENFTIKNDGGPDSFLNWKIDEYPSWGTWTFKPKKGTNLKPEDGPIQIEVEIQVPNKDNKEFIGEIKVINIENNENYEIIPVTISTPKNEGFNMFELLIRLLHLDENQFLFHLFQLFIS